jgi:hypothetical protein
MIPALPAGRGRQPLEKPYIAVLGVVRGRGPVFGNDADLSRKIERSSPRNPRSTGGPFGPHGRTWTTGWGRGATAAAGIAYLPDACFSSASSRADSAST